MTEIDPAIRHANRRNRLLHTLCSNETTKMLRRHREAMFQLHRYEIQLKNDLIDIQRLTNETHKEIKVVVDAAKLSRISNDLEAARRRYAERQNEKELEAAVPQRGNTAAHLSRRKTLTRAATSSAISIQTPTPKPSHS